ncbi:MFS transporter, partial [Staphylococcus pseudintermedius]
DKVDAGIRTGVFIALATCLRPLGGILGDKFNAVTMLKIFFSIMIAGAFILGVSSQISLFTIGCLTVSVCA